MEPKLNFENETRTTKKKRVKEDPRGAFETPGSYSFYILNLCFVPTIEF